MDDENSHEHLAMQFCGLTGSTSEDARQYLESNNWDINQAVGLYLESQDGDAQAGETAATDTSDPPPYTGPRTLDGRPAPSSETPQSRSSQKKPARSGGGIATLGTLGQSSSVRPPDSDDDSDDQDFKPDEEEPRDLFAGGEKSGLAVQDPSKQSKKNDPRKVVRDIVKKAQANGPSPGPSASGPSRFRGSGQTLGGDDAPSQIIPDPNPTEPEPGPVQARILHLWEEGFSVEDGPLHRFDDPSNTDDLRMIRQGRAPLHLMNVTRDQPVDVQLIKHDEPYKAPKKVYKPFGGSGQRLGSPTPGGSSPTFSPEPAIAPAAAPSSASAPTMNIDSNQPTLNLRVQLADGTRLPARFNTSHTVGDVYDFISQASPGSNDRAWVLATTFPNKDHTDKSQVLGDMPEFKRGGTAVQKWV